MIASLPGCRAAAGVALCACAIILGPTVDTRARSARDLASKASSYVHALDEQLVALVGSEHYEQRAYEGDTTRGAFEETRQLHSAIAWIHLQRAADTIAVREPMDGPGGASRLHALLRAPSSEIEGHVRALLNESAARNLAPGTRNINFPTFPLVYLRRPHLDRSRWRIETREGSRVLLSFEERQRPTVVRSDRGDHLRATGTFWIDERAGRVERSDVRLVGRQWVFVTVGPARSVATQVDYRQEVEYAPESRLGSWLPSRMTERYRQSGTGVYLEVRGDAMYSDYRRFETEGRLVTPE